MTINTCMVLDLLQDPWIFRTGSPGKITGSPINQTPSSWEKANKDSYHTSPSTNPSWNKPPKKRVTLMWIKQKIKTILQITIAAINHGKMGGLWHMFYPDPRHVRRWPTCRCSATPWPWDLLPRPFPGDLLGWSPGAKRMWLVSTHNM